MPGGLLTDSSSMEKKKGRVETERKEQREQQWIVCEKVTRKKNIRQIKLQKQED